MSMFERTELLLGAEGIEKLQKAHVLVFGVGGVGSYTVEALARAGVGALTLVDDDTVSESNLNRQLVALRSTQNQPKVQVAARRIADINPDCRVTPVQMFYTPETAPALPFEGFDYVVDAVDTVSAKIEIIRRAREAGVPVVSCSISGCSLLPVPMQLITGTPASRARRMISILAETVSTASTT